MGWNDRIDLDLYETVSDAVDEGHIEEGTPAYGGQESQILALRRPAGSRNERPGSMSHSRNFHFGRRLPISVNQKNPR